VRPQILYTAQLQNRVVLDYCNLSFEVHEDALAGLQGLKEVSFRDVVAEVDFTA
jgi:hypothetical protein